jgi:hypothetical protein
MENCKCASDEVFSPRRENPEMFMTTILSELNVEIEFTKCFPVDDKECIEGLWTSTPSLMLFKMKDHILLQRSS